MGNNDRRRDTEQGVYQLDRVIPVEGVRSRAKMATQGDVETLIPWGEGFGQDLGEAFTLRAESIRKLVDRNGMFVWVDERSAVEWVADGYGGLGRFSPGDVARHSQRVVPIFLPEALD